jgi:hypothetical protein
MSLVGGGLNGSTQHLHKTGSWVSAFNVYLELSEALAQ